MNHIAIDLGFQQSQICVRGKDSAILSEQRVKTLDLQKILAQEARSTVVMETSAESELVSSWGKASGHRVKIVPSLLSRQLGVGEHGVKTDQRDARALSLASCRLELPSVHIKSAPARDCWTRLTVRQSLVTARTQLINTVRGYLRARLVRVRSSSKDFPKNVRRELLKTPKGVPDYIEQILCSLEQLNTQLQKAEEAIAKIAKTNPVCARLMEIPGIGPMTSLAFVSAIDGPKRFPNASSVYSYLGLAPGEKSSGAKVRRTGITKAGPPMLRQYLTQASLTLLRCRRSDPLALWAAEIARRRSKHVATIAVARKLAGILWAMWRDETRFDPKRCVEGRTC